MSSDYVMQYKLLLSSLVHVAYTQAIWPRSDCSLRSSLIRVHIVCFYGTYCLLLGYILFASTVKVSLGALEYTNVCSRRNKQTFSEQN